MSGSQSKSFVHLFAPGPGGPGSVASGAGDGGAGVGGPDSIDADAREMIEWMKRTCKLKSFRPSKWTDEHDGIAAHFLNSPEMRKLVAYMGADGELIMLTPYSSFPAAPKAFCYWVRRESGASVTPRNIKVTLQFGAVNSGGVDSLLRLMQDVYMPTMKGTAQWPESVRKDFIGQMHRFMASVVETSFQAQVRGRNACCEVLPA